MHKRKYPGSTDCGASRPERGASAFCTLRIFSTEQKTSQGYKQAPHRSNMLGTYEYKEVLPQF
jgi:hypothetical protein